MRKIILIILLALPNLLFAYDAEIDGIYYNFKGEEAIVVSPNKSGSIVIPSVVTYDNITYTVTTIYDNAFCNCSELSSVVVPYSVTTMGYNAFSGCSNLRSVSIHRFYTPANLNTNEGIIRPHYEPWSLSEIFWHPS